jgi:hypothetical protein
MTSQREPTPHCKEFGHKYKSLTRVLIDDELVFKKVCLRCGLIVEKRMSKIL